MPTPERLRALANAKDPRAGITGLFFLAPAPGVTELLLIRHAQIEATNNDHDLHLTDLGREQADVLATYLASHVRLHALYASPTVRAQETAQALGQRQSLQVRTVEDLRDIQHLRPLDKPLAELMAEQYGAENVDAKIAEMGAKMTFDTLAPFLESSASFRDRVSRALDEIIGRHEGQRVAVVTHGPVIMSYVAVLLDSPRDFTLNPKLTSLTQILARGEKRTIDYLNATPHFEAHLPS